LAAVSTLGLRAPFADAAASHAKSGSYNYTLWNFDNSATLKSVKQAIATCSQELKHPKVSFNISNLTGSGATLYPSKIESLIASGSPPDTWESWGGTLAAPYIKAGGALGLSDWFDKFGWKKKLSPAAIKFLSYNGEPYGVPFNLISIPVFYNKTLYAKAGITPPKTYDEWESNNSALLKAGINPISEAFIDGWDVMRLFEHLLEVTAGPTLHDALLAQEASWNNSAVADAFGLLQKWNSLWLEKGALGTNPNDSTLLFTAGKCAQQLQGGWIVAQILGGGASVSDYDFFVPPGDKGPARMAGFAQQYMVSAKLSGPKLDALGEFYNIFVSKPIQQKYLINGSTATIGGVPTTGQPLLTKYLNATLKSELYTIQDQALSTQLANAYFALQAGVCGGSVTPKAAAAKMAAAVKKYGK
jgi:ABC-type glycerol-3-phosphate transport system substrate-binding protein